MNDEQKTPSAVNLEKRESTPTVVQPIETPVGAVRRAIDASVPSMSSPFTTLMRMNSARGGNARAAVEIIEPLIYQDLNYGAAVETIIEALGAANLVAEPNGERARDKKLAAEVQQNVLDTDAIRNIIEHLATVPDFGYALAELMWDTSTTPWKIRDVIPVNPGWVTFDQNDARTPLLLPAETNQLPKPLTPGKFIYVALPGYGLPYLRSHGYAAAFFKALAAMSMKDWAGFLEMFGQPMRKGTYDADAIADPAQLEAAKRVLRKALENLASDAWAMLPKGLEIELLESTTKGMSSDLYERFIRYTDELITKRKTGSVLATGTGNTGSGGSQALGSVHSEALLRKVMALGARIATGVRSAVEAYVRFNYGPDVPVPYVKFVFEEKKNLAEFTTAVDKMVRIGLEVAQDDVRSQMGLRKPADGEPLMRIATAPAGPADADPLEKEKSDDKKDADEDENV